MRLRISLLRGEMPDAIKQLGKSTFEDKENMTGFEDQEPGQRREPGEIPAQAEPAEAPALDREEAQFRADLPYNAQAELGYGPTFTKLQQKTGGEFGAVIVTMAGERRKAEFYSEEYLRTNQPGHYDHYHKVLEVDADDRFNPMKRQLIVLFREPIQHQNPDTGVMETVSGWWIRKGNATARFIRLDLPLDQIRNLARKQD